MKEAELEVLLKPILELYTQIEIELLENIATRFDTYPTIDGALEWYLDKMQELGAFKQTNVKILAKYAGLSSKELKHLMEELVFRSALEFKGANLNALLNSIANRNTLSSILDNLENDIKIINTKALESAEKSYMDILTKSTIETTSGIYSYQESIKHGLVKMAEHGIYGATYERSNGKVVHYSLEGTVRRDVLTRAHQVMFETQMNNMRELGHNLVYVSQHMGARVHKTNPIANHAGWQGKVYMLDGSSSKYPNLIEATGYGDIQGLAGVNCRHHISSYIEGVTKLPTRIDEEENERIYQKSQEQRRLERGVRKSKKELAIAKTIGDKDLIKKSRAKLKTRTDKLNTFVEAHPDMRRDYARTRISEEYKPKTLQKDLPAVLINDQNGGRGKKGKAYKSMASSTNETNGFRVYTGRIINNREELRPLVNELYNMNNKTAQQMFSLMSAQKREITIANLNKQEVSLYSRIAHGRLGNQPAIIMKQNDIRHLLNSGHLTGITSEGEIRMRKLTAQDLIDIKQVIKHPDSATGTEPNPRNGNKRILLEKQIENNHRLILEIDKHTGQLRVVTYFNIRKRRSR